MGRTAWVWILTQPLTGYVNTGEFVKLPMPQFPSLEMRMMKIVVSALQFALRIKWLSFVKCLGQCLTQSICLIGSLRPLSGQVLAFLVKGLLCWSSQPCLCSSFGNTLGAHAGALGLRVQIEKLQTTGKNWHSSFPDISFFHSSAAVSQLARVLLCSMWYWS